MSDKIIDIEGIGAVYKEKLHKEGITTTDELLNHCGSASGRKSMSGKIDVSEKVILEWVNRADLMRISGVGEEYSDLLEQAGVDTVKELATRNAGNLADKMKEVNGDNKFTKTTPSETVLEKWIAHAKTLAPKVTY